MERHSSNVELLRLWRHQNHPTASHQSLETRYHTVQQVRIWFKALKDTAHCVLLKHYYSVDFPWFDRKICFLSLFSKTWKLEKKVVKWQKFKTALCNLTEKWFLLNFFSLPFWTEISNHSGSQIHGWIFLKKNSIISVFILVFADQVTFTVNGLN